MTEAVFKETNGHRLGDFKYKTVNYEFNDFPHGDTPWNGRFITSQSVKSAWNTWFHIVSFVNFYDKQLTDEVCHYVVNGGYGAPFSILKLGPDEDFYPGFKELYEEMKEKDDLYRQIILDEDEWKFVPKDQLEKHFRYYLRGRIPYKYIVNSKKTKYNV